MSCRVEEDMSVTVIMKLRVWARKAARLADEGTGPRNLKDVECAAMVAAKLIDEGARPESQ